MWKRVAIVVLPLGALVLPVWLTEQALRIPSERRTEPDRSRAIAIASLTGTTWSEAEIVTPDGVKLKGWTFLPPAARDSGKTVILLHGAGDSRRGMLGFSQFFAQRGYSTLVVDSRGHGISGGSQVTYGLLEKRDIHRRADYLVGLRPTARLYGLGMSMGGAILIQALDTESRFRAIVAECSYSTFLVAATERIPRLTGLPVLFAGPIVSAAFLYGRMRYGFDLNGISPLESIRRTHTPVLLIHGLDDGRTGPEQSRELHAANPRSS